MNNTRWEPYQEKQKTQQQQQGGMKRPRPTTFGTTAGTIGSKATTSAATVAQPATKSRKVIRIVSALPRRLISSTVSSPSLLLTTTTSSSSSSPSAPLRTRTINKENSDKGLTTWKPYSGRTASAAVDAIIPCNPQMRLETILASMHGISGVRTISCTKVQGFFEKTNPEEINNYGHDVIQAVRDSNIDALQTFQRQGRPLKCSNRFGESLLHLACRKSLVPVVQFLVHHAKVPLNVIDDMGRSPLHDAFWTPEPNFDLVDIILKECPDLLLITDRRGHTPLSYTRHTHWSQWNDYLQKRKDILVPTTLLQKQLLSQEERQQQQQQC